MQRHDTGWQQAVVDLSPWRGQEVVVRFAVWNRDYEGDGVDFFNTWAYLDEVEVRPTWISRVYLPVVGRD